MSKAIDLNNTDSLAFLGKVNASISHELKNILAVISETAGLLSDLTEAAKRGRALEPEMLSSCSDAIIEEVQRGFAAIRRMNKFAHSVDDPVKKVDLAEVVELMVELSKFLSFSSKIRFDGSKAGIMVLTSPFLLQDVVYRTILQAFHSVGPDGNFEISVKPGKRGGGIVEFSGIQTSSGDRFSEEEKIRKAADFIGVETFFNPVSGTIALLVPETMEK